MARTTIANLQELINAQNVKIANLQELVNTQDTKITELAKAVTILTKLIADSNTATKAEPQKKVAEPQKKAPKEVAKNNKKTANITPDTHTKKDENYQGEKPRTREEALTQRYGAKEERREYAIRKANIKARAYEDTNAEAKATGKWMPKNEWKKLFDKKFSEYLKAEGLA